MKPSDYEFKIGDKVITTYGEVGHITDICECEMCQLRGFNEPVWVEDATGEEHYITNWEAEYGFNEYYQIGEYRFNKLFNKGLVVREIERLESELAKWEGMLDVIKELEKEK